MSTIKRILIPTDFSKIADLAIANGAEMAHIFNAKVYLLHSIETTMYTAGPGEPILVNDADKLYKLAVKQLDKCANEIRGKYNLDVTPLAAIGKAAYSITQAVKDNNIDIIIMGTHGASGYEELFLGSNAHKVVNLSPCPVITITHKTKHIGFKSIVVPIGNTINSRQKVNNAIELASKYNSTIHILGILQTEDKIEDEKFKIKLEPVEKALKNASIKYSKKIIRAENPAKEAMQFSGEINGDLILIMTDHESELTGIFMGVASKQIVNHSNIPVMSIRPIDTMIETFSPDGGDGVLL